MATPTLTANPEIVIVDREHEPSSSTTIHYEKDPTNAIWERWEGGAWSGPSYSMSSSRYSSETDDYTRTLRPGDTYEVGIYKDGYGPGTPNPALLASLIVYGLLKKPEARGLITDQNLAFGGTWSAHQVHTTVPTSILSIAVSRIPPRMIPPGIPLPVEPDGTSPPESPAKFVDNHEVEFDKIFPGNHYYYSVVVVDQFGNWDVRTQEFDALKRRMDIKFTKIHILDDGPGVGDAEFRFKVYTGSPRAQKVIEGFDTTEPGIDTGVEYTMGFAHVGVPVVVGPEEMEVKALS